MPECDYCGTSYLAYQMRTDRGPVCRCIGCLAIERGQQTLSLPFEAWLNRDEIEPPDHPDAPDFDPFDPRESDYYAARSWFKVLARVKEDDPILKRDPDASGTIDEDTREFLTNVMGEEAFVRPSEIDGGDPDA